MRVPFPRLCSQPGQCRHGRWQARLVRKKTALFRTRTTYPHTAPNVVDGREPRAGQAFLPRVQAAGMVQGAGWSR
jgi:hypothetical protein